MLRGINILLLFILISCEEPTNFPEIPITDSSILIQLEDNYLQLPEQAISISADGNTYAQYAKPTLKYTHGILGDAIEAEQLVVVQDSVFYELDLADEYVFEDIRPRLFDVNQDGALEFITIRSHQDLGAGIVIYKIEQGVLEEYAFVEEIGFSNKWLNLVGINDFTNDGQIEMVWVQTPHIGGILKYTVIEAGKLEPLDQTGEYSNHGIGEHNLCLSATTEINGEKLFYLPNQARTKIIGFKIMGENIELVEEIDFEVDFSMSLTDQYEFMNLIEELEDNCID